MFQINFSEIKRWENGYYDTQSSCNYRSWKLIFPAYPNERILTKISTYMLDSENIFVASHQDIKDKFRK